MSSPAILPNSSFTAIKGWFAGTNVANCVEKLQCIAFERTFPKVVNFVCDGKSRYFLVPEELAEVVAGSNFQETPITPDEGAFLNCVKSQLDGRVQMILDIASSGMDIAAKIIASKPGFIRAFEAPCDRGETYRRLVFEIRPPNS
jgi:hypothetical protein